MILLTDLEEHENVINPLELSITLIFFCWNRDTEHTRTSYCTIKPRKWSLKEILKNIIIMKCTDIEALSVCTTGFLGSGGPQIQVGRTKPKKGSKKAVLRSRCGYAWIHIDFALLNPDPDPGSK
jgi:hypothetical protein